MGVMSSASRTVRRDRDAGVVLLAMAVSLGACHGMDEPGPISGRDAIAAGDSTVAPDASVPDGHAEGRAADEGGAADASGDKGAAQPGSIVCSAVPAPLPFGLGFSKLVPSSTARIREAYPARLRFGFDDGSTLEFTWQGPTLDFRVGETVQLERSCRPYGPGCWDVVRGSRAVAAIWSASGFSTGNAEVPLDLPGAPRLGLRRACVFSEPSTCRGAPVVWGNVFDVQAEWQSGTTVIPVRVTEVVGPWRLTNIAAAAGPPSDGPGCVQEGGFTVSVSLLGSPE
jgi:hypothetical protein